jgi:hypothetical protein
MNKLNLLIFVLLVLICALGFSVYLQNKAVPEQVIEEIKPAALPPEPVKKPIVHYPVADTKTPTPETESPEKGKGESQPAVESTPPETLPPVQESDQSIQAALADLVSDKTIIGLLHIDNFIQKFVATVDNLPEKKLPRAHLPIIPPKGKFLVSGTIEEPQISARNYKRYGVYLRLMKSLDQDLALKVYTHFYPLFQSAYEQLGYKNAYFNDRLVYVIEHLLETPNPPDPILLRQPAVLYIYADGGLENLSAGQKILLRIGQEQRMEVFKILESYREKLTSLKP